MRRMTMFALVAVLVMLAGCVKLRSTIVIDADGSGTCTLNYGMSKDVADAIAAMGESDETARRRSPSTISIAPGWRSSREATASPSSRTSARTSMDATTWRSS